MAANWLAQHAQDMGIKSAVINIDSQACIKAVDHHKIKSKMALKTVTALNRAGSVLDRLTIRWVKAHLDDSQLHRGNHFADETAKLGAMAIDEEFLVHPDEVPLPSIASIKHEIYQYFVAEWNKRWKDTTRKPKCKATKDWFISINARTSFQLMSGRSKYL